MNIAIILAGGTGSRMSLDMPKQFALVKGKPIMAYTLSVFNESPLIDEIYLVSHKDYFEQSRNIIKQCKFEKVNGMFEGGKTRQESTYNALSVINAHDDDIILIHDCARPLVDLDIIENNIKACKQFDAVETAVKAVDTTIEVSNGILEHPLDRTKLYQVQTPQTFKYKLIKDAHENAIKNKLTDITDDAQLVAMLGYKVHIVEGKRSNLKITTNDDLKIMEALVK